MKISFDNQTLSKTGVSLICLWLILWACVTFTRPLLPIDETRCVSVAWEMWHNGNLLVPHLNGVSYSHKPPLLFWLILAGWKLFGVNEWWPRLLPPLFGLGCLFLTTLFARRLWPDKDDIVFTAPHILLGCVLWTLFTTVVMYDMLIVFFVLLSLLCLHSLAGGKRPFLIPIVLGMFLGLGILSKGPVILIPFVTVAVSVPWWWKNASIKEYLKFYVGVVFSLALAAAVALAWALPAAQSGGPEYAGAILWGQTASRVVGSFAHQRPWWWYIPLLPAILFPWTANPLFWRNIWKFELDDLGIRFCLSWLMPCLVIFSMISGKQVYYLLSLFPAFALLVARILAVSAVRRFDFMPLALSMFVVGVLMVVIPSIEWGNPLPPWLYQISPIYGIMVILVSFLVGGIPARTTKTLIWGSTVCMIFIMGIFQAAVFSEARPYYDVRPVAMLLKKMENNGYPLAHVNTYYGEFHFMGRLDKPMEVIKYIDQVPAWFKKNPQGRVLAYFRKWPTSVTSGLTPEYVGPYRGVNIVILRSVSSDEPSSN